MPSSLVTTAALLAFATRFGVVISSNVSMIVEQPHLTTGRGLRHDEATPSLCGRNERT